LGEIRFGSFAFSRPGCFRLGYGRDVQQGEEERIYGTFSGQVAGMITAIKPAAQILEDMVEEAVEVLTRRLPESVIAK
jgi:hypothetical protein